MRIIKRRINSKTKGGFFVMLPNDLEDLWYLYNLIVPGDVMSLKTFRKIKSEGKSQYSVVKVIRKEIKLEVSVLKVDFSADERGVSLFVKCKNIKENAFVALGQIQTITIELFKPIMVFKERWTRQAFRLVDDSVNESKKFDSLILLCQDGYCGFYILKNSLTILDSKLTKSMPKKRNNLMEVFKKKCSEFYQAVFHHLTSRYDISTLKLIVLAGPGPMKHKLFELMKNANIVVRDKKPPVKAEPVQMGKKGKKKKGKKSKGKPKVKEEDSGSSKKKKVIKNHQLILVNTSSVLKSALDEVLKDKKVMFQLNNTKAFLETQVLEEFYEIFSKNPSQAVYGKREVNFAISQGAIRKFLICDSLLRSNNFTRRQEFLKMYNQCSRQCGEKNIFVLSENHYSGQKLKEITGVAAILKFGVDLNDLYSDQEDESDVSETESEEEGNAQERKQSRLSDANLVNSLFLNAKDDPQEPPTPVDVEKMRKHFDQFQSEFKGQSQWDDNFM